MARVVLSWLARQDLENLWLHIAAVDLAAADRVLGQIERRIGTLSEYPEMAPLRLDVAPDMRALLVERWLVLYRLESGDVQIGRVRGWRA